MPSLSTNTNVIGVKIKYGPTLIRYKMPENAISEGWWDSTEPPKCQIMNSSIKT